jgi:hypothetical protein
MTLKGIDVSGYQSTNYPTDGFDFVFVKASEGTSYVNSEWSQQVAHGRDKGLAIGHYHFGRPGPWQAEANHFLNVVRPKLHTGDVLVYDWEVAGIPSEYKDAWIKYVKAQAPGHRVLLYANTDFWKNRDKTSYAGDGLWIADPNHPVGHPGITAKWLFHQYSSAQNLDRNVAQFATKTDLLKWTGAITDGGGHAPSLPGVSLSKIIHAAEIDPHAAQGHQTYQLGTLHIEQALVKLKFMASTRYAKDGSYGTETLRAYGEFQRWYSDKHNLHWTAAECNGVPGKTSLTALGDLSKVFHVIA